MMFNLEVTLVNIPCKWQTLFSLTGNCDFRKLVLYVHFHSIIKFSITIKGACNLHNLVCISLYFFPDFYQYFLTDIKKACEDRE